MGEIEVLEQEIEAKETDCVTRKRWGASTAVWGMLPTDFPRKGDILTSGKNLPIH